MRNKEKRMIQELNEKHLEILARRQGDRRKGEQGEKGGKCGTEGQENRGTGDMGTGRIGRTGEREKHVSEKEQGGGK
jgi:hypothetical protein